VPGPRAGALFLLGNLVGALRTKESVGVDALCADMAPIVDADARYSAVQICRHIMYRFPDPP
jgi:hypothetical protein